MPNTYILRNPFIAGKVKSKIKAKNSLEAAKIVYSNISEHFNNALPKFNFTLQKGGSGNGKYYHFLAKEERNENEVSYKIVSNEIEGDIEKFEQNFKKFKNNFDNLVGGKKKHKKSKKHKKHKKSKKDDTDEDDSESSESSESSTESSSSTSDNYKMISSYLPVTQPIYYWWYDPYIYSADSLYIPTFYSYTSPYIELATPYIYYL